MRGLGWSTAYVFSGTLGRATGVDNVTAVPSLAEIRARAWSIVFAPWTAAVVLLALLLVTVAYQFNLPSEIKLGGGYDGPYLNSIEPWAQGFGDAVRFDSGIANADQSANSDAEVGGGSLAPARPTAVAPPASGANYRWTHARPILLLPGVGVAAHLQLRAAASPAYPAGQQVQVLVNGQPLTTFALRPGPPAWQELDLGSSPSGNFAVEMRVTPHGAADPKSKAPQDGFQLYEVRLTPQPSGLLPPWGITLMLALAAFSLYSVLAYMGLPRSVAAGSTALGLVLAAGLLVQSRLTLTTYAGRLALLLLVAALAVPLLDWGLPRLFRRAGLLLPRTVWRGLLALFLVGLLLRGGGGLYPQLIVIDAPAHLLEIARVAQGQIWQQYTNHKLSEVPSQWHSALIIPYSTISYFLFAPLTLLPLDPAVSVNLINLFLDAARVFIVFGLACALGAGQRAAVVGAVLYLLLPCTWLLNSWGNWPTTLSFWLASLYLMLALLCYASLGRRPIWLSLTALLTLTMLVYTVAAVFLLLLIGIWAAGLVFGGRPPAAGDQRNGLLLGASALAAGGAALGLYYWQFLPDVVASWSGLGSTLVGGGGLGVPPSAFSTYLGSYLDRVFITYGVGPLGVLACVVACWAVLTPAAHATPAASPSLARQAAGRLPNRQSRWLVGAWLTVFSVFSLVGWKVDMVDKQVWFVAPLICALAGAALVAIWQQVRQPLLHTTGRLAVVALTGWLTYAAGALWLYRIFVKRH